MLIVHLSTIYWNELWTEQKTGKNIPDEMKARTLIFKGTKP